MTLSCGRCLEFIRQISDKNLDTKVLLKNGEVKKVSELLPVRWDFDEL